MITMIIKSITLCCTCGGYIFYDWII